MSASVPLVPAVDFSVTRTKIVAPAGTPAAPTVMASVAPLAPVLVPDVNDGEFHGLQSSKQSYGARTQFSLVKAMSCGCPL
jgi:hypothetical protein